MNGTFNLIPIKNVFAMKIDPHTTFLRAFGFPEPELEQQFALKSRASIKVSVYEVKGRVVRYDRGRAGGRLRSHDQRQE